MSSRILAGLAAVFLIAATSASEAVVPGGSYQQSCKNIKLKDEDSDSARIQAKCLDGNGKWQKTSFDLDRCWGDLANIDGKLVCVADQRAGAYQGQGYAPAGYPGDRSGAPKEVAVDVCSNWAVRMAYQDGAGYARLRKIEDVDRKDEGRIKVKGQVLTSRDAGERHSKERPFRCDVRDGQVIDFNWR